LNVFQKLTTLFNLAALTMIFLHEYIGEHGVSVCLKEADIL